MVARSLLMYRNVSITRLLEQLEENPLLWDAHTHRQYVGDGRPHAEMSDIWVRYNDMANLDPANPTAFNERHVPINYPAWYVLTALHPIVFGLMADVKGEMLGGILITRIPPGGKILPHVDQGWHVDYYKKFYLSLQSPPGAVFSFQDEGAPDDTREDVAPKPGDIWFIDNRRRHWVENNSEYERITAIICIRTEQLRFGGNDVS